MLTWANGRSRFSYLTSRTCRLITGHFGFKIQTCFHNTTPLLKKPAGSPNQILQISGPFPIRTLLAKYCNACFSFPPPFLISPFLPVFHPFSRHIESSILQKQLCSNWLMISWTPFSYGIFFSLRISMRVFQNQDLNEVLCKNLIENQEPHQNQNLEQDVIEILIEILNEDFLSLRISMRNSIRSCPRDLDFCWGSRWGSWLLMRTWGSYLITCILIERIILCPKSIKMSTGRVWW